MYASWNIRMKWESYVWFLRYGEKQTELSVTLDNFLPFYPPHLPPNNPKSKNFEKLKKKKKKKKTWRYCHFTKVNHTWKSCDVWFLRYGVKLTYFFVVLDKFLPFYPLAICKIKILKKWTKSLGLLSFYKCVPQMTIIWCMVLEIWNAKDRTFCLFGTFFALSFP